MILLNIITSYDTDFDCESHCIKIMFSFEKSFVNDGKYH